MKEAHFQLVAEWPAKQAPPMERHGDGLPGTAKHWMLYDLVLTVEFAKSFNAFKRLSLDDKVTCWFRAFLFNVSLMLGRCHSLHALFSYIYNDDRIGSDNHTVENYSIFTNLANFHLKVRY